MSKLTAKLLLGLLALVGIFTVISTRSGSRVNLVQANSVASVQLDTPFVVMYQPSDGRDATEDVFEAMKELNKRLIFVVEKGLDGKLLHVYDSVFVGFACQLVQNEQVVEALGSPKVTGLETETTQRFLAYLTNLSLDLLKKNKLEIIVDRDSTVSTQDIKGA